MESLIVDVGALDLPKGLSNSLEKKLEGAAAKLRDANEIAAINNSRPSATKSAPKQARRSLYRTLKT